MTESAFSRAERSSRRLAVVLGAAVLAWSVGNGLSARLATGLQPWLFSLRSVELAVVLAAALQHLWPLFLIPLGYVFGRWIDLRPLPFTLTALLGAEVVDVLVRGVTVGLGSLFDEPLAVAVELGLLLLSGALTALATRRGGAAAERGRARALAESAQAKTQYEAYVSSRGRPPEGG